MFIGFTVSALVSLSVLCLFISFCLLALPLLVFILLGVLCLLDYLVLTLARALMALPLHCP